MACKIAENAPLRALVHDLGIAPSCHSAIKRDCLHGLPGHDDLKGGVGAVIGWCQALFAQSATPTEHTKKFLAALTDAGVPLPASHEIFFSHREPKMPVGEFIAQAMDPLRATGRVPVVITGLDVVQNDECMEIMRSRPNIPPGETVLVRIMMDWGTSEMAARRLIKRLLYHARKEKKLPSWWPLLQSTYRVYVWRRLQSELGNKNFRYVNIAVNPWTENQVVEEFGDNITVAQVPIGLDSDIEDDGTIHLAPGMKISGSDAGASYNLFEYFGRLRGLSTAPTIIVLGPSSPYWSDDVNVARVKKIAPLLIRATREILWDRVPAKNQEMVLRLPA